jgi:hypothetical protein
MKRERPFEQRIVRAVRHRPSLVARESARA